MATNIFERASRMGLLFATVKGNATVTDLWGLPLTSKNGVSLDSVSKLVMTEVNSVKQESLVATPSASDTVTTLRVDILKHIIATKQADSEAQRGAAARAARRQELLALQDNNNKAADAALSPEDIQKELDSLG